MDNNKTKEIQIGEGLEFYQGYLGFQAKVADEFEKVKFLIISVVIVLLIMVAGLVFAYWEFTYKESRTIEEKFLENKLKTLELEKNAEMFKFCLKSGGWNKCF